MLILQSLHHRSFFFLCTFVSQQHPFPFPPGKVNRVKWFFWEQREEEGEGGKDNTYTTTEETPPEERGKQMTTHLIIRDIMLLKNT